jgi:hypothetical protein
VRMRVAARGEAASVVAFVLLCSASREVVATWRGKEANLTSTWTHGR